MSVERVHLKKGLKVIVQGYVDIEGEEKHVDAKAVVTEGPTHKNDSYVEVEIVSGKFKGHKVQVSPEKLNWRKQ